MRRWGWSGWGDGGGGGDVGGRVAEREGMTEREGGEGEGDGERGEGAMLVKISRAYSWACDGEL